MKVTILTIFILSSIFITPVFAGAGHTGNQFSDRKKSRITRWYNKSMVMKGAKIYEQNCSSCHMKNARGVSNWRKTDETGNYPAPPLNGTAHAWHHDHNSLRNIVREGGQAMGGTMPGFKDKLSDKEIDSVLAWIQSYWSDKIYGEWLRRS
ncbi:MAG: cytochrome c [Gammaproteobacteria bacterium]|nr:cytochrome c [Gammaproteobacteria bacterium]